jgi:hypothetical protein
LYRDILKEFDIDSIIAIEGVHKYTILYLKDGRKIKADLQLDLYNIQTKSKTAYFGTKSNYEEYIIDKLSEDSFEIDKKIGYVKQEEDYKDTLIKSIQEKVKDKSPKESLDIIFSDKEINKFETELGFIEMSKFYKSVLNKTIPKYLDKKIFSFNCYKENNNGEKDYTMCIYSEQKDNADAYLFSNKEKRFMKVELDKIEELEKQGLILGIRDKEKGTRRLKKIIQRKKQKENNEKILEI